MPFGVNYYRPGTGWAPQVWKQFDPQATRQDFERLRELGANCVRVFLSYGSFYTQSGELNPDGLAKFDRFLALAEGAGLYVHPTGPDHWEGLPAWAQGDRYADERHLAAIDDFWRLLATRYRGRAVIFAYDLLNEPEVRWDTPAMRDKWQHWLEKRYGSTAKIAAAWGVAADSLKSGEIPIPDGRSNRRGDRRLLDYQELREDIAAEWTRRQASAIHAADPEALVTVGLIQWSVPVGIAGPFHYSGFRPSRIAPFVDFMEVHFYPLESGFYTYGSEEAERRNLAYLECVVREVAATGKPVVVAEFGWFGGGKPTLENGAYPAATEAQQATWNSNLVARTRSLATGWLNWGFYDHPEAGDVSQLTGLLAVDGREKAWGRMFRELSRSLNAQDVAGLPARPLPLDWDACLTDAAAGNEHRQNLLRSVSGPPGSAPPPPR
jgi:endo-1,4-beta-mannosidase